MCGYLIITGKDKTLIPIIVTRGVKQYVPKSQTSFMVDRKFG